MDKFKPKSYLHFDYKTNYDQVRNRVGNPSWVEKHGFFPFIHKEKVTVKYIGNPQEATKEKIRDLYRASHIDSFIYSYYAEKLSYYYDIYAKKYGIDESVIGYRKNKGKSNIDYAAESFDFINNCESAYILLGDFEHFFDTLNHDYLKERLIEVLMGQYGRSLPLDWYKIFRSLTKFSWVNQKDLDKLFGSEIEQYKSKMKKYFYSTEEFRKFRRQDKSVHTNKEKFGIPQGTAISALFSNVYMIEFDRRLKEFVEKCDGKYFRYADDFILIIPSKNMEKQQFISLTDKLIKFSEEEAKLTIQKEKTKSYVFKANSVYTLDNKESIIDYLGFTFDGYNVRMRQKSVSKFYRKLNKAIINAKKRSIKKNSSSLIGKRSIYRYYSDLGESDKMGSKFGNFITYAKRCQRKFDSISPNTNNLMMYQMRNREKKLMEKMYFAMHNEENKRV
ncbi:hypothetical protein KV134_01615 [Tetragenococcus halophilus]|nr:hypothetical protein KV134_01615 [Tetragenococcus halophilus]